MQDFPLRVLKKYVWLNVFRDILQIIVKRAWSDIILSLKGL